MGRARKICRIIGCPEFATVGGLCDKHYKEIRSVDNRLSSSERGYDAEWARIRLEFLNAHPYCEDCDQRATEVDHRKPLREGGTHAWSNLAARCKSCHSSKTASEDGGFGNPVVSV